MTRKLPALYFIHLFVRNRMASGWSHEYIAHALRTRLHLADINPRTLDDEQRARYDAITALVATLEQPTYTK